MTRFFSAFILVMLGAANADAQQCRVVDVDFTPSDQLQIVAWVEKPDGTFIDTIYLTNKIGRFGMGNRPGRYDFNSGPIVNDLWPYGRRENTFPVWAHRHGKTWPKVVFQNGAENDLSHPAMQSTPEGAAYCRPMNALDPLDQPGWDAGTCATAAVGTDKGMLSSTSISLYPPRSDLVRVCNDVGCDAPSVTMFNMMNPFDAVTHATPKGGEQAELSWPIPANLPSGNYVLWLEVARAFDFNDSYNPMLYPAPQVSYGNYGKPYRGQPSVVYSVQFTVANAITMASTQAYVGYGDLDGSTGTLHPPDATITTDTPGSGASRLQILAGSAGDVVRVCARAEANTTPPGAIADLVVADTAPSSVSLQFTAPATAERTCSGGPGRVAGYEVRYRADEMTAANFADSSLAAVALPAVDAGTMESFEVEGLLPKTPYWVGVRAYDDCRNYSSLAIVQAATTDRVSGEVDACFIATAAYGSLMANDVEPLRHFRDTILRSTVFGELAIETYYTFGPSVAGVIGESELLRATARAALEPIVHAVRALRF